MLEIGAIVLWMVGVTTPIGFVRLPMSACVQAYGQFSVPLTTDMICLMKQF